MLWNDGGHILPSEIETNGEQMVAWNVGQFRGGLEEAKTRQLRGADGLILNKETKQSLLYLHLVSVGWLLPPSHRGKWGDV